MKCKTSNCFDAGQKMFEGYCLSCYQYIHRAGETDWPLWAMIAILAAIIVGLILM